MLEITKSIMESLELASAHFEASSDHWGVALRIYETINLPNGDN